MFHHVSMSMFILCFYLKAYFFIEKWRWFQIQFRGALMNAILQALEARERERGERERERERI